VAVVEMGRLLKESRAGRDSEKQLGDWVQSAKKAMDEAKAKMKKIEDDMLLLDQHSADFQRMKDDLELDKMRYQQLGRKLEKETDDRVVDAYEKNYAEAQRAIRSYAQTHGFDVVLQIDNRPIQANSEAEVVQRILWKNVVYADESLDITSEVLKILADK